MPGTVYNVDFMVKDSKRFADSGGWGYAVFMYDAASETYTAPHHGSHSRRRRTTPSVEPACHTIVKSKDYVFTEYGKR